MQGYLVWCILILRPAASALCQIDLYLRQMAIFVPIFALNKHGNRIITGMSLVCVFQNARIPVL